QAPVGVRASAMSGAGEAVLALAASKAAPITAGHVSVIALFVGGFVDVTVSAAGCCAVIVAGCGVDTAGVAVLPGDVGANPRRVIAKHIAVVGVRVRDAVTANVLRAFDAVVVRERVAVVVEFPVALLAGRLVAGVVAAGGSGA